MKPVKIAKKGKGKKRGKKPKNKSFTNSRPTTKTPVDQNMATITSILGGMGGGLNGAGKKSTRSIWWTEK